MYAGSDEHTAPHTRKLDTQRGVQLTTKLQNMHKKTGGKGVVEEALRSLGKLSKFAKDEARATMHKKKDRAGSRLWVKRKKRKSARPQQT